MIILSIIIPVYNVQDYISCAVESILNQTFTKLEVLLVNDGSTDNSGNICDEYAKLDSRVRVFHQKNQGVSQARNLGLENARGEYTTFLDPDDYIISADAYQYIFSKITAQTDTIHFGYKREVGSYKPSLIGMFTKKEFIDKLFPQFVGNTDDHYFSRFTMAPVWTLIVKTDLVKKLRFQKIRRTEDRIFFFEVIFSSKNILVLDDIIYFYRINPSSATHNYNSKFISDMIISINYQRSFFQKHQMTDKIKEEFDNSILYQFYSAIINETYSEDISKSVKLLKEYRTTQSVDKILSWKKALKLGKTNPLWFLIKMKQYRFIIKIYNLIKK